MGFSPSIGFGTVTAPQTPSGQQSSWATLLNNALLQASNAYTQFLATKRAMAPPPSTAWPWGASAQLPQGGAAQVGASPDRTQLVLLGLAGAAVVVALVFAVAKK